MPAKLRQKIMPHLWYTKEAEAAARFYASIFPNSRVDRVTPMPVASPSGPAGSVKVVDFRLFGQRFQAISAGPLDAFNHAISFVVLCDDQAELDGYWKALLKNGGKAEMCGWLRDRFGVSWQIVPAALDEMIGDRNKKRAIRVCEVMLQQQKLDIAALQAAYHGEEAAPRVGRGKPRRQAGRTAKRQAARRKSSSR